MKIYLIGLALIKPSTNTPTCAVFNVVYIFECFIFASAAASERDVGVRAKLLLARCCMLATNAAPAPA